MRLRRAQPAALAAAMLLLAVAHPAAAKELVIIGGDDGLPWAGGGGAIAPVIIVGPGLVSNENTPGAVVDFSRHEGWIFPESADRSRNILLDMEDRGGGVTAPASFEDLTSELAELIDNQASTAFERKPSEGRPANALGFILQVDLGARFGVSRVRFFPRNAAEDYLAPDYPFQDDFLKAYEIFLNDGTRETQNAARLPIFTSVLLESQNEEVVVDIEIPPQYVRYLQIKSQTTVGFEIAELQVFGEGFVPTAEYHSDIFDMGEALAVWGHLRWEEEAVGDALLSQAAISTRTGVDDSPVVFNRFREDGEEVPWKAADKLADGSSAQQLVAGLDAPDVEIRDARSRYSAQPLQVRVEISLTQDDWERLKPADRASMRDDLENWSTWTPPYLLTGQVTAADVLAGESGPPITSPSPRRYFQFKVEYSSEELFSARGIGSLSFDYTSPALAEEILAEIAPREALLGEDTDFSMVVIPSMRPGVDRGFNSVTVSTPVKVLAIQRIAMRLPGGTIQEQSFADVDLAAAPVQLGDFSIESVADDHFEIRFPTVEASLLQAEQMTVLEIDFKSVVLRAGTEFTLRASLEGTDELPQAAIGGNTVALSQTDNDAVFVLRDPSNLTVQVQKQSGLLANISADPKVVTPNGDLINDVTKIRFDITELTSGASVEAQIYDLSGRLVRTIPESGLHASGRYAWDWNGKDGSGNPVPPGLYLYKISVDADAGSSQRVGTVAVAY